MSSNNIFRLFVNKFNFGIYRCFWLIKFNLNKKITISVKEASKVYSLSRTTIYRLIKSGSINPTKVGSRTFLAVKELDNLFLGQHAA
jgi:excisionase family DNA binding protein